MSTRNPANTPETVAPQPRVYLSEPSTDNPVTLLRGRFSREHGTFALLIPSAERLRTKTTRKTVSVPFFHALGKNLSTVGAYTNQTSEFRAQIAHWFAAYDAQDLVVFDAHALFPGTMRAIFEYAATVRRITFVSEPGYYQRTRKAVMAAGVEPEHLDWDHLVERLPQVPAPTPPPVAAYEMRHLPITDFLLFRHRARTLNTPDVFEAIDADYRTAYKHALDLHLDRPNTKTKAGGDTSSPKTKSRDGNPNLQAVVTMLATVTRDATDTAPIMVALRATQAALLTHGWVLTAHQDKAIGTLCSIKSPNPTAEHWRALHGYVRTHRVAGVALYLLNIAPDDLNTITICEVTGALDEGHLRGAPIPDLARPLLLSHLHHRASQDAAPTEPYLNQRGERRHLEDLIEARRHLGIPIDARFLRGGDLTHAERPIWRFGLDLRSAT